MLVLYSALLVSLSLLQIASQHTLHEVTNVKDMDSEETTRHSGGRTSSKKLTTVNALNQTTSDDKSSAGVTKQSFNFKDPHFTAELISSPWVVFFNMFIPPEKTPGRSHALFTIDDQIRQISMSYATESLKAGDKTLIILYNTIGSPTDPSADVNTICQKYSDRRSGGGSSRGVANKEEKGSTNERLNCIHMQHYESDTFEEVTLQRSHEYCQLHPNQSIIYVHNKGAYHPNPKNTRWRRYMTTAVTGKHCLDSMEMIGSSLENESLLPQSEKLQSRKSSVNLAKSKLRNCNVCGLVATAIPWIHFTGNFFTAQCSYLRNLLPPELYSQKLSKLVVPTILQKKEMGELTFGNFPYDDAYIGLGRFANEHWIGSHPSVQMCDVTGNITIIDWKKQNHPLPTNEFIWSVFPHPDNDELVLPNPNRKQKKRLREYYHLAGNMLKWIILYNKIPDDSSWVWKYYPDGKIWRDAYQKYGKETLDKLLA